VSAAVAEPRWQRRAQPWLGTLVEIGLAVGPRGGESGFQAGFDEIRIVQGALSRFDATSDVSRFRALRRGERIRVAPATQQVLRAARELQRATAGAFDITLGSAPDGWECVEDELCKLDDAARLDLGGIGKGHAVDLAVETLIRHGCGSGWVNAGGDLRCFGEAELPVRLRDEAHGGVHAFASLRDGAFATSHFDRSSRSQLTRSGAGDAAVHTSVAAPLCLWADALTKVVAHSGDAAHPLLARFGAVAWIH
jgi:thiamine biosynthesis lipoprotein